MTVLVTGGAGYIGSQMVYELVDAGERVVVLDNLSTGHRWAVAAGVPLVVGQTGDQALVSRIISEHGVEAIIHFAASLIVPDSVRDPLGYYRNNTVNSRALIECVVQGGVRHFIFSSTAAVYGNPPTSPTGEDSPTLPISPYGWSKLMTEIMLRDAARAHGLRHVTLRYFNVAGADPRGRTGQSSVAATHLIKSRPRPHWGCGRNSRFSAPIIRPRTALASAINIRVGDLAGAHLHALRYLRSGGPSLTLNCGYGHGFSVREVIDTVKRVSGVDFKVENAPRREGDPARIVAAKRARARRPWLAAALRRSFADCDRCARGGRQLLERFRRGDGRDPNHAEIA